MACLGSALSSVLDPNQVWGFVQGYPTVIYDSWGYHYLSEILRTKGLLAWPTDLRTYGYPA